MSLNNNQNSEMSNKTILADTTVSETLDTRWAYTALDVKFKDHAVPDEIMIDKTNGQVYYKRSDGTVVTYDPYLAEVSENIVLVSEINNSIKDWLNETGEYLRIPDDSSSVMLNSKIPVDKFSNNNELPYGIGLVDAKFTVSPTSNGFFVRVSTRPEDSNYIELLTSKYNFDNKIKTSTNAKMIYRVKYTDSNKKSATKIYTKDIKLNKLELIPIVSKMDSPTDPIFNTLTGTITIIEVEITNVSSTAISQTYNISHKNELPYSLVIADDGKVIVDEISVNIFIDGYDKVSITSPMSIRHIIQSKFILEETVSFGGMTADEKNTMNTLSDKVNNIPRFIISKNAPNSEIMKTGDIWAQLTSSSTGVPRKTLNITGTNTTFNKDELEKFLIENTELITEFSLSEDDRDSIFINLK